MLQSSISMSRSYQSLNSCQSARSDAKQRKLSRRQSAAMATELTTFEFKYGREDVRVVVFFVCFLSALLGIFCFLFKSEPFMFLLVFALKFLKHNINTECITFNFCVLFSLPESSGFRGLYNIYYYFLNVIYKYLWFFFLNNFLH